jgi:ribonuclease BN (tRNA processing enzyme)
MQQKKTKLVFNGVRGSRPVADKRVNKYGGNTSSILVEKGDRIVIFDAGTGIINIGDYLKKERTDIKILDIFLTHFHFDHILGLPFFQPILSRGYKINIYSAPYNKDNRSAKDVILTIFNQPYSPISSEGIKAEINFIELDINDKEAIPIGEGMSVAYQKNNSHPLCGVLIYKLTTEGKSIVYATDVETPGGFAGVTLDFISGADILIHDSQYFDSHYDAAESPKKGFGHSSVSMAVQNAKNARAKTLYLFHYDPAYSDRELEIMLKEARKVFKNTFLSEELKIINF